MMGWNSSTSSPRSIARRQGWRATAACASQNDCAAAEQADTAAGLLLACTWPCRQRRKIRERAAVGRVDRRADTGGDVEFAAANQERLRQCVGNGLGSHAWRPQRCRHRVQNAKLVTAQASGDGVLPVSAWSKRSLHLAQHFVTGAVAEGVVDVLELIEIEQQQGCRRVVTTVAGLVDVVVDLGDQALAVEQPGQRVPEGEMLKQ